MRPENVHVPREEFLAVWDEARRRGTEPGVDGYAAAVAQTCRWLAAVPMRTALCGGLPRSPVTQRACVARAELIEAECRAAETDDGYAPAVACRPGWRDGVRATFRWAWEGRGPAPIEIAPA
ncbi:hypothetical protein [Pseudonocardia endophytica]|uniref:hypothetical protein n=1 Tax=Pseudonocardia endophytica TaxID=401976 RepID=UPI00104D566A|nr:hypothetical protein [Pseudonocardia endophytica]